MGTTLYVSKCGDGLAVHIPQDIAQELGVWEGSAIEIVPKGSKLALQKKRYTLAELVAQITDDNLHSEHDFGPPQGKEIW